MGGMSEFPATADSSLGVKTSRVNVADRLASVAIDRPDALALVAANKRGDFDSITYGDLDRDATQIALGLQAMGIGPGKRIVMLVRPGIDFVTLVFALLRTGATMVLVDAGLGRENIVRCLASTKPDGFVAIPLGQLMRLVKRKQFPKAKLNVTVFDRFPLGWLSGGKTLTSIKRLGGPDASLLPHTTADDPAAIVFTSGSTGPPKGVLYRHETFVTQADEIQNQYDLSAGAFDLACFPLFGLFNVACGITTIFPDMDFSRPAACDPKKLIHAANHWKCSQAFASPAVWDKLSHYCESTGERIPTLRNVFSCGAPVPAKVMQRTLAAVHPEAKMHTPYGATESLPVATIEAEEVITETAAATDRGAGVCVGRRFETIDWRIIRITDEPIRSIEETEELPLGEIGELIVRGPQVSQEYLALDESIGRHNELAKIADGDTIWHRIGDVGYFDQTSHDGKQRFWYCGRKSQRVVTDETTLYTECVEQLANTVSGIKRTALVGVGERGKQRPVLIVEREADSSISEAINEAELSDSLTALLTTLLSKHPCSNAIKTLFFHPQLPVDIRHNSKIYREKLALWAAEQLA